LSNQCILKNVLSTCKIDKTYGKKELSDTQKRTITSSSQSRGDGFHDTLNKEFEKFVYHTNCYSKYTSKEKISHLKNARTNLLEQSLEKSYKGKISFACSLIN